MPDIIEWGPQDEHGDDYDPEVVAAIQRAVWSVSTNYERYVEKKGVFDS